MGLDMYLSKETYVKNWDHMSPEHLTQVTVIRNGEPLKGVKPERISYITEQVAYWRKANAIHRWFVQKVQGGVDECQKAYVSRDQLQELVDLCKSVLNSIETVPGDVHTGTVYDADGVHEKFKPGTVVAQKGVAQQMLPTQSGFFFGGTDYDEGYIQDLQNTINQIVPLLEEEEDGSFYYQSSW